MVERRRWWQWKREEMVAVRSDSWGGVRVEREAMIIASEVEFFPSIMGSCAKKGTCELFKAGVLCLIISPRTPPPQVFYKIRHFCTWAETDQHVWRIEWQHGKYL